MEKKDPRHMDKLELPINENIIQEMRLCILNFQAKYCGQKPSALILSSRAFLQFKFWIDHEHSGTEILEMVDGLKYLGVNILCADIPGKMIPAFPSDLISLLEYNKQEPKK